MTNRPTNGIFNRSTEAYVTELSLRPRWITSTGMTFDFTNFFTKSFRALEIFKLILSPLAFVSSIYISIFDSTTACTSSLKCIDRSNFFKLS